MVQLPRELIDRLDRRASREQVSRSKLIRDAIKAYLEDDGSQAVADAYASGYTRIPFGAPDEWGDVEAFHDALARERLQGL